MNAYLPERFPNDGNVVEEWSKFSEARQLLYDTILNSGVKSPMIVSGDVLAQFMRKDCVKASGMIQSSRISRPNPQVRPLVEITTSGLTHSWGTSFSSQPKHHRLPLKPYSYFVSNVFMAICHWVCGWNDILIQSTKEESEEGGKSGLQYYLGLNFAEFEFDFSEDEGKGGGSVTTRIFGKEEDAVPKLEMSWTFDELSGNTQAKGNTAQYLQDYLSMNIENVDDEWICIPHRGITSMFREYVANTIMFISFCILFFFPHVIILYLVRKIWLSWKRV